MVRSNFLKTCCLLKTAIYLRLMKNVLTNNLKDCSALESALTNVDQLDFQLVPTFVYF